MSDNKMVVEMARRCAPAAPEDLSEGRNGGLRRLVERQVPTAWMTARIEARDRGFSGEDHAGNAAADEAAGWWTASAALPAEKLRARARATTTTTLHQRRCIGDVASTTLMPASRMLLTD